MCLEQEEPTADTANSFLVVAPEMCPGHLISYFGDLLLQGHSPDRQFATTIRTINVLQAIIKM